MDRDKWEIAQPTADLDFRGGPYDYYSIALPDPANSELYERAKENLLAFRIFPPDRIKSEILSPAGQVAEDVTIIQEIFFGPLKFECGVRVIRVFEDQAETLRTFGFSYATLQGHIERGVCTFKIVQDCPKKTFNFSVETRTAPAHPGVWLAKPVLRYFQKKRNEEALAYFRTHL